MTESKKLQAAIVAFLILCFLFIARAVAVGLHHMSLADAIYLYQVDCMEDGREIDIWQADKESYSDTYRRWWDWGYGNILDEEKYRLIRPYIGRKVEYYVKREVNERDKK